MGQNEKTYITGRASVYCTTAATRTSRLLREKLGSQPGNELMHDVTVIDEEEELRDVLRGKAHIDLASDGSYDPDTGIRPMGG
jgi:hypothetical protein